MVFTDVKIIVNWIDKEGNIDKSDFIELGDILITKFQNMSTVTFVIKDNKN